MGLTTERKPAEKRARMLKRQAEIRKLRGKVDWKGDLDRMRSGA